jgi:hypothetical protein
MREGKEEGGEGGGRGRREEGGRRKDFVAWRSRVAKEGGGRRKNLLPNKMFPQILR